IVERNHRVTDEERRQLAVSAENRPPMLLTTSFFGLFVAVGAFAAGAGLGSRVLVPLLFGGLFGGVPFLMSLVPIFNASLWVLAPLASALLAIGYLKGRSWQATLRSTGRARGAAAGWVTGFDTTSSPSGVSSDSGSSSSSSSSDSFGGGDSGGGGASGSWGRPPAH